MFILFTQQKFRKNLKGKPYLKNGQLCQDLNGEYKNFTVSTSISTFRLFSIHYAEKVRSGVKHIEVVRVYLTAGFERKRNINKFPQIVYDTTLFHKAEFNGLAGFIEEFKNVDAMTTILLDDSQYHNIEWKEIVKNLKTMVDRIESTSAFTKEEIAYFRDYILDMQACLKDA